MPIYSYRCATCGFQQDVLRKMSDPLLVTCPSCGASTFVKQVTAAGFQLKGSGWYATDFRNPAGKESSKGADPGDESGGTKDGAKEGASAPGGAPASADSDSAPAKPASGAGADSGSDSSPPKAAPAPKTGSS